MTSEAGYELLEHTADAGLVAWGPDAATAFCQAAYGMFALILGQEQARLDSTKESERLDIRVGGEEWDDLLVNWLAEVLFYFDTEGLVPIHIDFRQCAPPQCVAALDCVRLIDPEELGGVGVKAITYHQLYVRVSEEQTELRVIFDI